MNYISNKKLNIFKMFEIYSKSNIGKYLPGNIMQYVGRNLLGTKYKLTQIDIAFGSFIEIIAIIATVFIIVTSFTFNELRNLLLKSYYSYSFLSLKYLGIIILVILGMLLFFKKSKNIYKYYKLLMRKEFLLLCVKLFFIYSFTVTISGFLMVFIYKFGLGIKVEVSQYFYIVSRFMISWIVGFIIPGSPGGIGIREYLLIDSLSPVFGNENTILVALLYRLVSILGDLLAFVLGIIIEKFNSE